MATVGNQNQDAGGGRVGSGLVHVRMRGITKRYGATVANDGVDFELYRGEIHALLGENGAGKTTLMSILFGLVSADEGAVWLGEEQMRFSSPHDALARGIGMVHQHFMLVQRFTVAESVVLGSVSPWNMALRRSQIEQQVQAASERFGMAIDPRRRIRELPIDTQQRVEILKLLYRGANVLILDEPTSSLGPAQIEALFATLNDLRVSGHSIVIVTHKLGEVMEIADRVTVLRDGRNAAMMQRGSFDERSLARAMTGRELEELPPRTKMGDEADEPLLRIRDLVVDAGTRLHAVHGVSLEVRGGEILGVAGVEGNGQRELVDALGGVTKIQAGEIWIEGRDLTGAQPQVRHAAGLSVIPEDRQGWGLVLDMTLAENIALAAVPAGAFSRRGLLAKKSIREHARRLLEEYDVRPPDPDLRVLSLSGGNQQKVVLARELSRDPKVLVAANPTHGLDVGATEYVQRRLLEVREAGNAVLLVSNDLDELLKLADRIVVLYRGKILYEAVVTDVSIDDLALAMAGKAPGGSSGGEPRRRRRPRVAAEPERLGVPNVSELLDGTARRLTAPVGLTWRPAGRTAAALAATVGIFALLLQLLGANAGNALKALVTGSVGTQFNLGQTIMIASLLALTGLAAAIPFSAHLWNVGGEGQLWFGAFATVGVALTLPSDLPHWLFTPIVVAIACVAGAAWGFVPGLLKAAINANEVITSLMMTFIAIELGNWAIDGLWPQGASNSTADAPGHALMPNIWNGTLVTAGAPLAVAAVFVAWVIMARTRFGFEIRAIGLNANAARMNGMRFGRVAVGTFVLGGAFAGLGGSIFVLGINDNLPAGFDQSSFGYLGIAVALVARLNPAWIIPSAFLFAALRVGSNGLQAETGLSTTIGQILVAMFVVLLLAFRVIRLRYAEAVQ